MTIGGTTVLDLNGFTLTITAPYRTAAVIVGTGKSLTIQDSVGSGVLNATGDNAAGIGATRGGTNGTIVINSGTINATGGVSSAAIGSASALTSSLDITINGGTINATGGTAAAAIGSGQAGVFTGQIAVHGGTITTTSTSGAGIGTGHSTNATGVSIDITGGTINADGPIGATTGAMGPITISGGTINATGIGATGSSGTSNAITISGGTISLAGIGRLIGSEPARNGVANGPINITGGTVTANITFGSFMVLALGPDANGRETTVTGGQIKTNSAIFSVAGASIVGLPASAFQPSSGSQSWTLHDSVSAATVGFQPGDIVPMPSASSRTVTIGETTAMQYLVLYRSNGGSDDFAAGNYDPANGAYAIAANPFTPPTGTTFLGWGTTPSSGVSSIFAPSQPYSTAASVSLFAQWTTPSAPSSSPSPSSSQAPSQGSSSVSSSSSASASPSAVATGSITLAATGTEPTALAALALSLGALGFLASRRHRSRA